MIDSLFLSYNQKNESLPFISIKTIKNNCAYIFVENFSNEKNNLNLTCRGWVDISCLAIHPSTETSKIFLRATPKENARIVDSIENIQWTDLYSIKKVKNKWLLIEYEDSGGKKHSGWISPKDQNSSYTPTC